MLLPQPVRLSPASALMRTLNMVRELFTRLAGLSAPRRRRLPFVCGQMRALGSDVVYHRTIAASLWRLNSLAARERLNV